MPSNPRRQISSTTRSNVCRRRSHGFTIIEFLTTLTIILVLIAVMLPAIQHARSVSKAVQCQNKLKQILLALHTYHDSNETFPPGHIEIMGIKGETRTNGWAWGAFLLPYLDQQPLFQSIDFNVGMIATTPSEYSEYQNLQFGAGPISNLTVVATDLPAYRCTSDQTPALLRRFHPGIGGVDYATSSYAGMTGIDWMDLPCATIANKPGEPLPALTSPPCYPNDGAFYLNSRVRMRDVRDGLSQTIGIGEVSWRLDHLTDPDQPRVAPAMGGSHWARVGDPRLPQHVLTATVDGLNKPDSAGFSTGMNSYHPGGAYAGMLDGSVQFLSDSIDSNPFEPFGVLQNLSTIRGDEPDSQF